MYNLENIRYIYCDLSINIEFIINIKFSLKNRL